MLEVVENGRNSMLRAAIKSPVHKVATFFVDKGLTANEMTYLGFAGSIISSILIARDNLKPKAEQIPWWAKAIPLALAKSTDAVDGTMAELQKTSNPNGDAASDRTSETISELAIMSSNPKARSLALIGIFTNFGPSLARAYQESRGVTVKEDAMGAYPARSVFEMISLIFPDVADISQSVQNITSLISTVQRLKTKKKPIAKDKQSKKEQVMSAEAAKKSKQRLFLLLGMAAVSGVVGLAYYKHLEKSSK